MLTLLDANISASKDQYFSTLGNTEAGVQRKERKRHRILLLLFSLRPRIHLLGHVVEGRRAHAVHDETASVTESSRSKSVDNVRSYLGLAVADSL